MPTCENPVDVPIKKHRLLGFYGLTRPFNFKVAIPFLLNTGILALVLLTAATLFVAKGLYLGTELFYFFVYIACALLVGALLSKIRTLSYALLCWCVIELGLAAANADLRPQNSVTEVDPFDYAFIYHPLLQLVPRPNWHYKNHIDFRGREDEAKDGGVDMASLQGQELDFSHNSLGERGKELTPDDLAKKVILVYGGSTTYDVAVTQGETWVEHLQADLDNKYTLVNLGVVGHSTEEHLIDTAFYQSVIPKKPVCAIYYVGWNDAINAHISNLDSAYADYHLLTMAIRKPDLTIARYSPLFYLANEMAKGRFDTVPEIPNILGRPTIAGPDPRLEAIVLEHVRTIAAINNGRGTKTIFIGQIINKDWPKGPNIWAPLVGKGGFPPLIERLNSIVKEQTASIPAKYIDAGNENFDHHDFVDYAHFAVPGARKFASRIAKEVGDYCE
jgi:hypothetical protein